MAAFKNIVVFGGTGAQAGSVVRHLASIGGYKIRVPTRDPASANAKAIGSLPHVELLRASYETEEGLRAAFQGQDACYFLVNSFAIREPEEYFWTFRAYEIAAQSKLKLFIYSGTDSRHRAFGYDEAHRNSHNIVKANISDWFHRQDTNILPWSIVTGGVYAEMLGSLLRPMPAGSKYVFAAPVNEQSVIPLVPLAHYGNAVAWALQNPDIARGRFVHAPVFQVTWPQISEAFEKATGKPSGFLSVSQGQWFEGASKEVNPDMTLPPGANSSDLATFTFRQSFGAWWNLWKDGRFSLELNDTPVPATFSSLSEWMEKTEYQATVFDKLKPQPE